MWTRSSGSYTTTKPLAFAASLLAHEARLACWALVDDAGARYFSWEGRYGRGVPLAPGCLTTRVIAEALSTLWSEAGSTQSTYAGHRSAAIVTRRGVGHCHSPCADAVPLC